jgi:hypothetical protein
MKEMKEALKKMMPFKAPGEDKIPVEVIKNLPIDLMENYLYIFNQCLIHKEIPKCWKRGVIRLIYKSGDKGHPANYRPITLFNTTYKLFATILNKRLTSFIESKNIISPLQAGFRNGRNSIQQISIIKKF